MTQPALPPRAQPPQPTSGIRSMRHTIQAKSDQLNADDLVGEHVVVEILDVVVTGAPDQPVTVRISGGFRPWKPCKTERRVLVHAWGENGDVYIGRRLKLCRDPDVTWAGQKVGGVRIAAMSDITGEIRISLTASNKKKAPRVVKALDANETASTDPFRDTLIAATKRAENPWTMDQIKHWLLEGRKAADIPSYDRPAILERLAGPPTPPAEDEL